MALAVPPGVAPVVDVLLAVPLGVAAAVDVVQNPSTSTWSLNPSNEEADDLQDIDASTDDLFDKADWANSANNAAFCELCVEEITAGNSNKGHLTNRAYNNIAAKFEERTGLRHSKQQFKNRWDALRRMYAFWLYANKQSGLGWGRGTVVADDAWWKKHTKNHGEWRKLRYGPPDNLDELQVIESDEGDEGDVGDRSPERTLPRKRCRSTSTTATSPRKRTKSPMVKMTYSSSDDDDESASKSSSTDEDEVNRNALGQLELVHQFGAVACIFDEEYMPMPTTAASQASGATNLLGDEDIDMNAFRDAIANALFHNEE
nr:L10-interacting MYB domain-containing protein-like [Setaria viridis]